MPEAIPIQYQQRKLHNGTLEAADFIEDPRVRGSHIQDYSLDQGYLNGYPEPYAEPEENNCYLKTAEGGRKSTCDNERCKKDAQMGLDIISKLRQLFNWHPSSSSDHYNTAQQESKRKRRLVFDEL